MKTIFYGVFYFFLTVFFIYIFVKEKDLAKKFDAHRENFVNKIIEKYNIKNENNIKYFKKSLYYIETLGTALILVVIIQRFYIGNFKIPTGSMIPTIEVGDRVFADMVSYKFTTPKRNSIIVFKEPIQDKVLYTKRAMGLPGERIKIEEDVLYINGEKTDFRRYSNLGIGDKEWKIPQKNDKLQIIPAGNYNEAYKSVSFDIAEVQKKLKNNSSLIYELMPNLKFVVNGEETGPILDFIHDKDILDKLMRGETIEITLKDNYYLALGDNTDNSFDSRYWGFVKESRIRGRALVRFWPLNRMGLVK
ncbi:signal peptidase I [Fusobacterium nucleatum subsp. nucleatum ATCC 23726]|uniref:Signal peptidase I n=2 Tax=Fusobacterium nucleatum subsp. nucleatum TaxID=76856 RepID=A0ABM6TPN6_FUSNN|nr:signal peptidase I [Fusobacterium nucleatum]AVQ14839.1 signal peptidase I [Fusobacterium nucleatum subsp. nucleatum ATCC 25586]AVQ23037.1 signal peptidase I [Fusobacterium nucleatum subsp. nucleatum ATCC 23726]WMS29684.1 signal peptidase I [Fusobacterium nucleatum]